MVIFRKILSPAGLSHCQLRYFTSINFHWMRFVPFYFHSTSLPWKWPEVVEAHNIDERIHNKFRCSESVFFFFFSSNRTFWQTYQFSFNDDIHFSCKTNNFCYIHNELILNPSFEIRRGRIDNKVLAISMIQGITYWGILYSGNSQS